METLAKIWFDRLIFGTGFGMIKDNVLTHIPVTDVVLHKIPCSMCGDYTTPDNMDGLVCKECLPNIGEEEI